MKLKKSREKIIEELVYDFKNDFNQFCFAPMQWPMIDGTSGQSILNHNVITVMEFCPFSHLCTYASN